MAQQKTVSNGAQVELAKGIDASVFGHSMLRILYSETKAGSQTNEMRFALQFGDCAYYEKGGYEGYVFHPEPKVVETPGYVLVLSGHGFSLANAYLTMQKEIGSMEGTGELVYNEMKLPGGKCDYSFKEILSSEPPRPNEAPGRSLRLSLLNKLSSAVKAMSGMYVEDLQSANGCYLAGFEGEVSLLSKISYAAHLAEEAVKNESEFLNGLKRKQ